MIIAISGTPGCGKSTFAKRLAKLISYEYIEITQFIKEHKLADEFDEVDQSLVVDTKKVDDALKTHLQANANYIIDGHFSHDLEAATGCIVCTCDISVLNERLITRKYSAEKVRENLDSEIFQICYTESIENGLPTVKIDCSDELTDAQITNSFKELLTLLKQ